MTRQLYTPEFKRRAVALLLESDKFVARMDQDIDIKENTLYNWKNCIRISLILPFLIHFNCLSKN
ncbi:transposase [Limnobaculum parvum]